MPPRPVEAAATSRSGAGTWACRDPCRADVGRPLANTTARRHNPNLHGTKAERETDPRQGCGQGRDLTSGAGTPIVVSRTAMAVLGRSGVTRSPAPADMPSRWEEIDAQETD